MSVGVVTVVGTTTSMASVRAMGVSMASVESGGALNAIFNIPKASDSTLGGVKIPSGGVIEIDSDGNITIDESALSLEVGATATVDNNIGTPTVSVTPSKSNGKTTLTFSFKNLKGEKGDKGDPLEYSDLTESEKESLRGQDGTTPIKGTHYWTDSDKAEIVNDVLAELPNGNEVAY